MDLESISVWASTAWRRALTNVEAVLSIWSFQISVSCGKMSVRTCNLNCKLNWWATKRVTEWESTSRSKKEQSPLIKKYKRRSNYTGSNKQVIIFFSLGGELSVCANKMNWRASDGIWHIDKIQIQRCIFLWCLRFCFPIWGTWLSS